MTGRYCWNGAMWMSVDKHAAGSTDSFAAVVIKRNRIFVLFNKLFIQSIEHLEECHPGRYIIHLVGFKVPFCGGIFLPPDLKCQLHMLFYFKTVFLFEINVSKSTNWYAVRGTRCAAEYFIWFRLTQHTPGHVPLFIASDFQLYFLEFEIFFIKNRSFPFPSIFPCSNVSKFFIVPEGFSIGC